MTLVLIVDDSLLSRKMITDSLTNVGFEVVTANNGLIGLEMFDKHHPDCIVTDLLMPVMTGQEFIGRLREKSVDVPVFVVTSDIQESSRAECEALGICGFLNKPVLGGKLVSCLQAAFSTTSGAKS